MQQLNLLPNDNKEQVFEKAKIYAENLGLEIEDIDTSKPWGGALYFASESIKLFISSFFSEVDEKDIFKYGDQLSPKFLIVGANEMLSWQYHDRRAELWKSIAGPVGVKESSTDDQPEEVKILNFDDWIQHGALARHRLLGLDSWGVIAEIWQHTDPLKLSDEEDIIRLDDHYGRA